MEFSKRHRREPLELQLTAMIDIFTMIVIFLVMGTVIGVAEVSVPAKTTLPKSSSVEALDAAPQVVMSVEEDANGRKSTFVQVKSLSGELGALPKIPLEEFHAQANGSTSKKIQELESLLKKAIEKLSPEQRKGGVLLNVVADQSTPYRDLFNVIKIFRESGFESLLFVASGDRKLGQLGRDSETPAGAGP